MQRSRRRKSSHHGSICGTSHFRLSPFSLVADSNPQVGWYVTSSPAAATWTTSVLSSLGISSRLLAPLGTGQLFDLAEMVAVGMQHALSTPQNMLDYVAPGIQCEGILTGYWMSDPDTTKFSGAVNKIKGQDNDTCNGLTNGQAAYGLFDLLDSFSTIDFGKIRERLFRA